MVMTMIYSSPFVMNKSSFLQKVG